MVTNNAANNSTAATGKVLQGAGVGVASTYSTATYPSTAGTSGNVLTSNGTNWSSSAPTGLASIGIQAFINAAQPNVTGDGTALTVNWTNSSWVSGGSNMTAGVFTVPSGGAGKYLIAYGITLDNLSASFTSGEFKIEGNLGTASRKVFNPAAGRTSGNQYQVTDQMITDLGVGNTIYVTASVSGGTKTVGFTGDSFGQFGYVSIARIFT